MRFAKEDLQKTDRVALEATTNTWPVVDLLRPHVARIVVGNPLKTKAITEAKVKTDKVLAQLLRCEYLPEVWQPDDATQMQRSLPPTLSPDQLPAGERRMLSERQLSEFV